MKVSKKAFGVTKAGEKVYTYSIMNKNGMEIVLSDYGANIVKIVVPNQKKELIDIALGYDQVKDYELNSPGFGSFIGRHANRIENAETTIHGVLYKLEKNDGNNNLHSGSKSYNKVMYETEIFEEEDEVSIEFSRLSPHMEQGFPGNLDYSSPDSRSSEWNRSRCRTSLMY